jgi:hypothetical protein
MVSIMSLYDDNVKRALFDDEEHQEGTRCGDCGLTESERYKKNGSFDNCMNMVDDGLKWVCEECYEKNKYILCEKCGNSFEEDDDCINCA